MPATPTPDPGPRDETRRAEKTRILNRLRRLEGQVRGLHKMVDENRGCEETLTLLAGVRAALDATADAILENYLETCRAENEDDPQAIVRAVRLARG